MESIYDPSPFWRLGLVQRVTCMQSFDEIRRSLQKTTWQEELVQEGDPGWIADLSRHRGFSGWHLHLASSAMLYAHRHGFGVPYGERVVVIKGTIQDTDVAGHTVYLTAGQQIIHGPDTLHQPVVDDFCIFLVHRPVPLLPLFPFPA